MLLGKGTLRTSKVYICSSYTRQVLDIHDEIYEAICNSFTL